MMKSVSRSALTASILVCFSCALAVPRAVEANNSRHDTRYRVASQTTPQVTPHPDWSGQAIALERQGNWQGLLQLGRQWSQAQPNNATAWFILGRALGELNRLPEAISAYKINLRIEPGDVHARNNLGNAYRNSNSYLQAMFAYRDAVRINPEYVPAWQNLGLTFYQLKGMTGVSQALQQLHTSDPELAEAWYKLAIQYSQSHDARIAQQAIGVLRGLPNARRERMLKILLAGM
jgi:tetratricopeptide (TPR) repeat protein